MTYLSPQEKNARHQHEPDGDSFGEIHLVRRK